MTVNSWIEKISIPTYKTGEPEKNPMFLEKRVYQGSSGVVYPHPVIEKIEDNRSMQEYTAVFLENEYLKIMILPELGGRIHRAYDKVQKRDFVYYNQVIKPALVGLTGPWISGGIEFNWPQHHRPSTFVAVDHTIEINADGSHTVWVNELEIMFRTRGMAGFTLYPDKAYLEIKGRVFNRTAFPQTFLWWANPAVKVNEHYQSIFPPDVYAVFDHGKRDVSDFPVATGTYYKVNYAPGTDISRYHTIPVPTSYMAINSKYDFMGCYENDTRAGMLHVADHHVSPGKKQWTWGNGDFGYAWDRNLTDEDGPYIELMTGVFTDNQPDFSWLQPNEGKNFEQYFMPYSKLGQVKNATRDAMVNLDWQDGHLLVKVYATSFYEQAFILLYHNNTIFKSFRSNLSPYEVFEQSILPEAEYRETEWRLAVTDKDSRELVSYAPEPLEHKEIPAAASAAKAPAEIEQVEDLYLNGLHLEQYRHATFNPIDYYKEGLIRSPGDVRCNNAMGLLLLRRGQFAEAENYLHTAIKTLTGRNPNPYDGESYYHLGWSFLLQQKKEEAYNAFYKACWNDAWQHGAFLMLARISCSRAQYELALQHIDKSLNRNYNSPIARHIKSIVLNQLNRNAGQFIEESIAIDKFNYGCFFEKYLMLEERGEEDKASKVLLQLQQLMRGAEQNYLELALDYSHAGMYHSAIRLLELYVPLQANKPMPFYYLGWLYVQDGKPEQARQYFEVAAVHPPDLCFPNRVEEIIILKAAIAYNPADGKAWYYLGNLWYDKRQYDEAVTCWENATMLDPDFPTPYRNLSLAYFNKRRDKDKALISLEKAFYLDSNDARVLMELDQLYKIMGKMPDERLRFLDQYQVLVGSRDDLSLERITLLNSLGRFQEAADLMALRRFHPWEGGEGKVVGQYLYSHLELAKQAILNKAYERALELLAATINYPENLGEGKLFGTPENDIHYFMGCAFEGLGDSLQARGYFEKAASGNTEPALAIYYNDSQPDKIVYRALAWRKLGEPEKADALFNRFIQFANDNTDIEVSIDYFAVSLPDMLVFDADLREKNRLHCRYILALGTIGLGDISRGKQLLEEIIQKDAGHQGAISFLAMVPFFKKNSMINYA